jgi:hypothetical protein
MASHSFHAARLRKSVEEFAFDLRLKLRMLQNRPTSAARRRASIMATPS